LKEEISCMFSFERGWLLLLLKLVLLKFVLLKLVKEEAEAR